MKAVELAKTSCYGSFEAGSYRHSQVAFVLVSVEKEIRD